MKRSKYFCPPDYLIPGAEELEIIGVGDVTIEDVYHRVTTGSNGIYAIEVDSATQVKKPVYFYPPEIKTNSEQGLAALDKLHQRLEAAFGKERVAFGLKGKYNS